MTIDRSWVAEVLEADNPRARGEALALYAAAFCTYWESEANIRANGLICAHPRTGAPLENPYLKVRDQAMKSIAAMSKARLQTDRLWREAGERVGAP